MNQVIISTRNTAKAYKTTSLIIAVVSVILGIVAFCICGVLAEYTKNKGVLLLLLLGLYCIIEGIIKIWKSSVSGSTYLDVYTDRLIGKGMQNLSALSFDIMLKDVNNISIEKGFWIHIQTNSGVYKIMTNEKTAAAVLDFYVTTRA